MWHEPDELVLARISIGEAPQSLSDRAYVMWNIKLRSELGFKNAAEYGGYRAVPGRWGPSTSVKREALCDGGCQYSPARAAAGLYYPCNLSAGSPMRFMLCPTDRQLVEFDATVRMARQILAAPLSDMPLELRGYDGFRSPTIVGVGGIFRPGGLRAQQFFHGQNVWMDEYPEDNVYWSGGGATSTPAPTATSTPTAVFDLHRTRDMLMPIGVEDVEIPAPPPARQGESPMLRVRGWLAVNTPNWFRLWISPRLMIAFALLAIWAVLVALQTAYPPRVDEIISGFIAFLVMIAGPKPLKWFYDTIGLPGGAWRVIVTYVVAIVLAFVALVMAGVITNQPLDINAVLSLGGILLAAASAAYHRLKDLGEFAVN